VVISLSRSHEVRSFASKTYKQLFSRFMQSDPWWSLAMAVNVFLVFFMAASPNSFRKYLWVYAVGCFGLPGLPALICLVYAPYGERIYGNATVGAPRW